MHLVIQQHMCIRFIDIVVVLSPLLLQQWLLMPLPLPLLPPLLLTLISDLVQVEDARACSRDEHGVVLRGGRAFLKASTAATHMYTEKKACQRL